MFTNIFVKYLFNLDLFYFSNWFYKNIFDPVKVFVKDWS